MNRKILESSVADISTWPQIRLEELPAPKAAIAERRVNALKLYLSGKSIATVHAATGLDRRRVNRLIRRALTLHPDGRIFGLRACLWYNRVEPYHRSAPSPSLDKRAAHGHAGLLRRLFDRYPKIRESVINEAFEAGSGEFTENILRGDKLHLSFIEECLRAGIPRNEYPFNVENQGATGLFRFLKKELELRNLRRMVNASFGEDAARKLGSSWTPVRIGSRLKCYERVEFDGYRIDCICTLEIRDPAGGVPVLLPLERIWVLVIVEVTSRAVLGYHVCFGRHYSAEDVLTCIENSVVPWSRRELRTPGLEYTDLSGLPSGVIPELAFAKWGEIAIDNDKSNCAKWVWEKIQEKLGCVINPGPVRTPDRRQFIERFFRAIAQNGFQRLPTTTGSSPADIRRRDPEAAALRYKFTLEELLDLVDVMVAEYNGTPTTALYNRSPLDYLRAALDGKTFFVRHIPEADRTGFTLTRKRVVATVRGNLKKGERPYIRFEGVRYFSERLGNLPSLIGKQVVIECNTKDLRTITLFTQGGEEIDKLTVSQSWAYHAHDLRTRKAILRCIQLGKFGRRDAADPVRSFMKAKATEALLAKKPRNELAHAIRVKNQAPADTRAPTPSTPTSRTPDPVTSTRLPEMPTMRRRGAPAVKIVSLFTSY